MLLKIRDLATGWLAVLIVVILVIPFAFFGIDYYFSQGSEPYVARVEDTEIKQTQYQRALANYIQQMQNIMGSSVDTDDPFIKQQTINSMINAEVLNQTTLKSGLNIADARVLETIRTFEVFHDSEGFDADIYQRSINSLGTPPAVFEQQVKLDMMSEQLEAAISESSFTTENEIEDIVRLKKQTRDFSYIVVPVKSIKETIAVSDEEIENYYQQNQSLYRQPKQIKSEYLHLTREKIASQLQVTTEELENYFANNQNAYNEPEKRQFWQIKIGKPENATDEQIQAAREKAEEVLKFSESVDSFEIIAETFSSSGNDAIKVDVSESGLKERGKSTKIIDDAVFALNKGETSEILDDLNAFYIVHLVDIQDLREVEFSEVQDKVETDLRQEKAQKRYYVLADQMAALSYEHPDTLQVASDAIDIAIEQSDYFTGTDEVDNDLFDNPKIITASFSDDVLVNGNNSDIIEISDDEAVVLRVIDVIDEGQKSLAEVRDQVIATLEDVKAKNAVGDIGKQILQKVQAGESADELLQQHGLELQQAEQAERDDISLNRSVIRTAFRLAPPEADTSTVEGTQLGNGDYVVVSLQSVNFPEKLMGIDINNQGLEMRQVRAAADWDGYFDALKDNTEISIVESNL